MSLLQVGAGVASAALTAVSTSISEYFADKSFFKREYNIPALAFLLASLGLLMAMLGPDLLRAWWEGLGTDLKLIVTALASLLFILFAELSRPLALWVRRLYGGELPRLAWWQRGLRKPYLRQSLDLKEEAVTLQRAGSDLAQASSILESLDRECKPPAGNTQLPVLRTALAAYQAVTLDAWTWRTFPDDQVPKGAVISPADLLGHYGLGPLPAGEPVLAARLLPVPSQDYLTGRQLLSLPLSPTDPGLNLQAGQVVSLRLTPRRGTGTAIEVTDLLAVDRPAPEQVVLSVPEARVKEILARLRSNDLAFTRSAAPDGKLLLAVPVARKELSPGQLIGDEHIDWTLVDGPQPLTSRLALREDQLYDRVYWPSGLEPVPDEPYRLQPVLKKSARFNRDNLLGREEADRLGYLFHPGWMTYTQSGRPGYRLAYRLYPVTCQTRGGEPSWSAVQDGKEIHFILPESIRTAHPMAKAAPPPPNIQAGQPIAPGDRVEVSFQDPGVKPRDSEPLCFVLQIDEKDGAYAFYLAVRHPEEFHRKLLAASSIWISPFCDVPVLKKPLAPGRLLPREKDPPTIPLRANQMLNMALEPQDLDNRYVRLEPDEPLPADEPIPLDRLEPAIGGGRSIITLDRTQSSATIHLLAGSQALHRGDLVSVGLRLQGQTGPPAELAWSGAFVRYVDPLPPQPAGTIRLLELDIPTGQETLAEFLWQSGADVEVRVTHSDGLVKEKMDDARRSIPTRERVLDALNATLTDKKPDQAALRDRAQELLGLAGTLKTLRAALDRRPWQGDDPPMDFAYKSAEDDFWRDAYKPLKNAVALWLDAIAKLLQDRRLGAQLSLPDNLADTRPTEFGNILAAAADHAYSAYGIDTATILPRLLQVLDVKDEKDLMDKPVTRLANAESSMTMMLLFSFWAGLWTVLGTLALFAQFLIMRTPGWLFPVVLVGGPLVWHVARVGATSHAFAYGEAIKSLFDLRRRRLFSAIGYDVPEAMTPEEEKKHWQKLYWLFAEGNTKGTDFPALKTGS